jgi:hypothetical protein
MPEGVYEETLAVADKIKSGELTAPSTEDEYNEFVAK